MMHLQTGVIILDLMGLVSVKDCPRPRLLRMHLRKNEITREMYSELQILTRKDNTLS